MRRRLTVLLPLLAAVAVALAALADPAWAIPAFARKYQFSCSTCHAPFPRLKPYGEEFAGRGFRLAPDQEPPRATYDVGDPLLKMARDFPIAARFDGFAAYKQEAAARTDFEWPYTFKVLSGGPLSEKVSYYVYFILEKGDVEGLEDAYLQINRPFGLPFDLIAGQFQVSDPLFKRELRLERTDYLIYKTRVGLVHADLTYDRGLMFLGELPGEVETVLQVVNGNGIHSADNLGNFDRDSNKNVALRLARTIGPVRVGAFAYRGKEDGEAGTSNTTTYFGPDLMVDFSKEVQLNVQYLERRDGDPFFVGQPGPDYKTRGGFAELHWLPFGEDGRWSFSGLYNKVDSDDLEARRETFSLTAGYLLARNVRVLMEAGRDLEAKRKLASVGLVTAF
jgi:hypothetical protein